MEIDQILRCSVQGRDFFWDSWEAVRGGGRGAAPTNNANIFSWVSGKFEGRAIRDYPNSKYRFRELPGRNCFLSFKSTVFSALIICVSRLKFSIFTNRSFAYFILIFSLLRSDYSYFLNFKFFISIDKLIEFWPSTLQILLF